MHHTDQCGEHDALIAVCRATGWTPQQIAALPLDFYEELIARLNAEGREAPEWAKQGNR